MNEPRFQMRRFFTVDLENNIDIVCNCLDSEMALFVSELAAELKCGTGDVFVDFGNQPDFLTGMRGIIRACLVRIIK